METNVDSTPEILTALQYVLILPKETEHYNFGRNSLLETEDVELYRRYISYFVKIEDRLTDVLLDQLPSLSSLSGNSPLYLPFVTVTEILAKDLSPTVQQYIKEILRRNCDPFIEAIGVHMLLIYHSTISPFFLHNISKNVMRFFSSLHSNVILPNDLFPILSSLRSLLFSSIRPLRLIARSTTEAVEIPLELPKMLSLALDGVNQDDVKSDIIVVIGKTGAGKSTLINYLMGVKFTLEESLQSGEMYLQHLPGQILFTRVGHSFDSKTLYPQIIQGTDYCFCDTPGFRDNRGGDTAVCALLGIPLAVSQSNGIRALIITIDYTSTTAESGRGESFSTLSKTLSKILSSKAFEAMKEEKKQGKRVPLFFAITKPRFNTKFDPTTMKKQLMYRVNSILTNKDKQMKSLDTTIAESNVLSKEIADLEDCIIELQGFYKTKNKHNQSGLSKYLFNVTGHSKAIEQGTIELTVQEESKKWLKFNPDVTEKLQNLLRRIVPMDEKEREENLKKQKKEWKNELKKKQEKMAKLNSIIENVQGEYHVLELLKEYQENIFIIRGVESDIKDDKDNLFEAINELRRTNQEVKRQNLCFDPMSDEYSAVRDYITSTSQELYRQIHLLESLSIDISTTESQIKAKMKEKSDKEKELNEELIPDNKKRKNNLTKTLENKIKKIDSEINQWHKDSVEMDLEIEGKQKEITNIDQHPIIEYGSLRYFEERWSIGRWLGFTTRWKYSFPHRDLPIERVLLSTLYYTQNQTESKILFSEPLLDTLEECNPNLSQYVEYSNSGIHLTKISTTQQIYEMQTIPNMMLNPSIKSSGKIMINEQELNSGRFSFSYEGNSGENGHLVARFYVLPKYLASYKNKIKVVEDNIQQLKKRKEKILRDIVEKNKILSDDKEYLRLITLGSGTDEKRIDRLCTLLFLLGYSVGTFIDKIIAELNNKDEIKNHLIDLINEVEFNKLKGVLPPHLKKEYYEAILGTQLTNSKINLKEPDDPTAQRIRLLQQVYEATGLTFHAQHKILKALCQVPSGNTPSLTDQLNEVNKKDTIHKCLFENLRNSLLKDQKVSTVRAIIKLFQMEEGNTAVKDFISLEKKFTEHLQITYPKDQLNPKYYDQAIDHIAHYSTKYQQRYGLKLNQLLPVKQLHSESKFEDFFDQVRCGKLNFKLVTKPFNSKNHEIFEEWKPPPSFYTTTVLDLLQISRKDLAQILSLADEKHKLLIIPEIKEAILREEFILSEQPGLRNRIQLRKSSHLGEIQIEQNEKRYIKHILQSKSTFDNYVAYLKHNGSPIGWRLIYLLSEIKADFCVFTSNSSYSKSAPDSLHGLHFSVTRAFEYNLLIPKPRFTEESLDSGFFQVN